MTKISSILTLSVATMLAACTQLPKEAYYTHGQPESLFIHSKQQKQFAVNSKANVKEILNWVKNENPSTASLACQDDSKYCNKIERVLERGGVTTTRSQAEHNSVTFTYDHTAARDCDAHYIDNMINPYNLNHPAFGCSVAVNTVQMVTNKKVFSDPHLMDDIEDGRKGVQSTDLYNTPSKPDTNFSAMVTSGSR